MAEHASRTIHIGLGPIGRASVREAVAGGLRPVGGVDTDPQYEGRDLGVVAGGEALDARVTTKIDDTPPADIAILCTGSSLVRVAPTLIELAERGLHVVSTCEELAYPWRLNPEVAAEIDGAAQRSGVAIVGTGVNPGFILDTLVLDVARASANVEHVLARRRVDVSTRRPQLQQKVGVGLTPSEFAEKTTALGHVGLVESLQMVVDGLGFGDAETTFSMDPVVADADLVAGGTTVERGRCLGMRQVAAATVDGREVARVELEMAFGLEEAADDITVTGRPPVHVVVAGGVQGDQATAALVVAAARTIALTQPGLRCMPELPLTAHLHRPASPAS